MTSATYEPPSPQDHAHDPPAPADRSGVGPSGAELAETNRQLHTAIASRELIGQATGILMIRLDTDAESAFSYLRRRSMDENRKLVRIAKDIVETRKIA
ncbi:ANTAR domain-containing protein [Nocardioides sp. zg-1308]|uniref:ANTAR domain-containing protein n=1 Tax=Nocardioides renjunii TaxID=3095075 RepID=A0ABU5K6E7_9ACTN|nr:MULTISPECIES: ANTAR domain-containing protein [unclassified Nocardioides]MDZ5660413.1 ANTAR domain-containing protein [Nocardioides sp. S-58]NPD03522.1 ANTAR domain-containing protein [Nocardioides sp. zg-1308]WQQ21413.1 ANTAR domain-containing protein [Nocardioides sp. S-34]